MVETVTMTAMSLPLHPLLVHAAVVLVPVFAIAALLWAARPAWGWWLRWPVLVGGVVTPIIVFITRLTGDRLRDDLGMRSPAVEHHEKMSNLLLLSTGVMLLAAVLAWVTLPVHSPIPGGAHREGRWPALALVSRVVLVLAAIAVGVTVYLTGDSGARMVWQR